MARETDKQKAAFEAYYMMGDARSLSKVAQTFGVTSASVCNWKQKFNWDARVKALDAANYRDIREYDKKQVLNEIIAYRKIIKTSVAEYIKKLKEGGIEIKSVNDLSKLIRLDLDLLIYIDNNKDDRTEKDDYVEFFFSDKGQ